MHSLEGRLVRVVLKGELDLKTADPLRQALDKLLDRYRDRDLLLDLAEVPFVDSSGLGVLLGRYRRLAAQGRGISLTGVRPGVRSLLELAGIDSIMNVNKEVPGKSEPAAPR